MNDKHDLRFEEELTHGAADFINRESNRNSLITVTRALPSKDKKRVTILVTVLPSEMEESALFFLKRKRSDFLSYLKKHTRIKRPPTIDFAIDMGEKNRERLDILSKE